MIVSEALVRGLDVCPRSEHQLSWRSRSPSGEAPAPGAERLREACRQAPGLIGTALAEFDFRRATSAVWGIVDEANRYVNHSRPWELAKAERAGDEHAGHQLDATLVALVRACRAIAERLSPFLPDAAARVARQCTPLDGRLLSPSPVFRRIATRTDACGKPAQAMGSLEPEPLGDPAQGVTP
ncbi:hypothetical protein GCM10022252_48300 [Streptosporangium oxazolinicum]|uniref:Methionyl-tRNA synthetase anticodon-binding domain-containing protein n=1 Tax=Streptosporangium oxazolinicum TaxID=909287 RepID=A0ABP8B5H5_9ACTN